MTQERKHKFEWDGKTTTSGGLCFMCVHWINGCECSDFEIHQCDRERWDAFYAANPQIVRVIKPGEDL